MKYFLWLFAIILFSCSKNESKPKDAIEFNGKWVESKARIDTLSFETSENSNLMIFLRGTEMRDGNLLPKVFSGPYEYRIEEDKIWLYWQLSSNSNFNDYYFKLNGNLIEMGNFYESELGEILNFEKLK